MKAMVGVYILIVGAHEVKHVATNTAKVGHRNLYA